MYIAASCSPQLEASQGDGVVLKVLVGCAISEHAQAGVLAHCGAWQQRAVVGDVTGLSQHDWGGAARGSSNDSDHAAGRRQKGWQTTLSV